MVRALPAAQRALNHSRAKEAAYKDAVAIYTESHRTFEASSDRNRKAPISLRDLAARYRGLISVTTLSRRIKRLPSALEVGQLRTRRAIMEVGNDILRARCGREHSNFRPWSTSLHSSRAQCVNATVLEAWNSLQERAQRGDFTDGSPILPENIANMDETLLGRFLRMVHPRARL